MRKVNTADIFSAARLIRASGLRDELIPVIKRATEIEDIKELGIDGILAIVEALAERKSEQAIYELLAGPLEMTADEVAAMQLDPLLDNLTELAKQNDFKLFFKRLSGILGKT